MNENITIEGTKVVGSVLIVDHNESTLSKMVGSLNKRFPSIIVDSVLTTEEAVCLAEKKIGKDEYNLFIIDTEGDQISGIDLVSVLGGMNGYKDTPFIFISEVEEIKETMQRDFPDIDIFMKPTETHGRIFASRVQRFLLLVDTLSRMKSAVSSIEEMYEITKLSGMTHGTGKIHT